MKAFYSLCLMVITIFILTGCNNDIKLIDSKQSSNDKSKEIVRCFDEKDIEGLKNLFCEEVINSHNLDEEIQQAFDFYEGKSVSYDLYYGGSSGGWDNGVCVDEHITPQIKNLKTDNDKIYRIPYHEYVIYKQNPKCVGITYIRIFDESSDDMVQIGEHVY